MSPPHRSPNVRSVRGTLRILAFSPVHMAKGHGSRRTKSQRWLQLRHHTHSTSTWAKALAPGMRSPTICRYLALCTGDGRAASTVWRALLRFSFYYWAQCLTSDELDQHKMWLDCVLLEWVPQSWPSADWQLIRLTCPRIDFSGLCGVGKAQYGGLCKRRHFTSWWGQLSCY